MAWVETRSGAINLERVDSLVGLYGNEEIGENPHIIWVTAMQDGKERHVIGIGSDLDVIGDKEEMCKSIIQYLASLATSTLYIKHTDIAKMVEGHK